MTEIRVKPLERTELNEKASKFAGYSHRDDFCNSWALCGLLIDWKYISIHKNQDDDSWAATNGDIWEIDQGLCKEPVIMCIADDPKVAVATVFVEMCERGL